MLDIQQFIAEKGGDPEIIRQSQKKRGESVEIVDKVIESYQRWVRTKYELDGLNRIINGIQKQIGLSIKDKSPYENLKSTKTKIESKKSSLSVLEAAERIEVDSLLQSIGNIVHTSVPVSLTEDDNQIVRKWFPINYEKDRPNLLSHHELLSKINGYDPERGAKISGHRGYFLRNDGVFLQQALINYSLQFLREKGYIALQTPEMINKDVMKKTAQLQQFDDELYKVIDGNDEKYLIATSEQPISAYHSGEWFEKPGEQLPLKYAGISNCYRREAGAHGKDAWGIFRVHNFVKIEQFLFTEPEKSWEAHEAMISIAEEYYQTLGIPYRIINIVSGALNNAAAKKYDLEAWFPFQKEYKELVSASNCTDYQSRRLEIRCGVKKMNSREKKYVHCLNATLCATTRTICAILENYQTSDGPDGKPGIYVPDKLQPYLGGRKFLEFDCSN